MPAPDQVLIADDDPQVRALLQDLFSGEGYQTHAAQDGAAALRELTERRFDLLVLDLHMPGANGIEVLTDLRRRQIRTPALVISGAATETSRDSVRRLAPADLLAKPLDLPEVLRRARALRTPADQNPAAASTPLHILVADDHEPTRELLSEFLRDAGHNVICVADGTLGLAAAERANPRFDVALLDVVMPGLPGHELVDALRFASPETVPILITGEATQDQIRQGYSDGAVSLLRKPIDLHSLRRVVEGCAEECARRRESAAAQRSAAAAPAWRRAWATLFRYLRAPRGTPEHRRALTAAVVLASVAIGLLLTRLLLVLQQEVDHARAFQDKMEDTAGKMEEYMEWDRRHKEELNGKGPDGGGTRR